MFLDRVIHFRETLGDQVKGRSPKKLESLIEVPNVVHVKVLVLSFKIILISTQWRVLYRVIHFREDLKHTVKDRSPKKLKILIAFPLSMPSESTCSMLQNNASLISVACS